MAPQLDKGTVAVLREPDRAWWVRAVGLRGVLLLEEHDVWGHLPAPSAPGPQVQQSEGSDRGSTVTQAPRSGPWPGACTAPHGILRALPKVPPPLGPLLTSGMSFRMFPLGFSLELSFCTYPQLGDQGL